MIVLSLFDGISCGQVALERAGIKVDAYLASEIDKYAIQITQKNYPNAIQLGDIKEIDGTCLPPIDLLMGGSPCQGFSFAGKQLNFNDPRSYLFFEFVRLLHECRPKWFLLENVRMKKEYQDVISNVLGVEPILINSALVSAQNRNRLYWTNIPNIEQPKDKKIYFCDILEENANCFYYTNESFNWLFKSEKRKNKYKQYSKKTKEKMQMIEASHYKGYSNQRCFGIEDKRGVRYISIVECERLQTLPDNYTEGISNTQRYKCIGNGWTVDIIAHILKGIKENA